MNYVEICRDVFVLVDDIGNGFFNIEFSVCGIFVIMVEVVMFVLFVF